MKPYPFFLLFVAITFCNICIGQSYKSVSTESLDEKTFKKILNEQFSSLITGKSETGVGNFISLDLEKTEANIEGNLITKQGQILGLKASGNMSDGVLSKFNNSGSEPKVSLEGQFHIMNFKNPKNHSLTYFDESYQDFKKKVDSVQNKFRVDSISIKYGQWLTNLKLKSEKIKNVIQTLNKRLTVDKNSAVIDSLKYAIALNESDLKINDSLIKTYNIKNPNVSLLEDLRNSKSKWLKKTKPEIELYSFNFHWVSIYYKVSINNFK